MSEIKAALTAEQWDSVLGIDKTAQPLDWPQCRDYYKRTFVKFGFDWGGDHGLAALTLYDQPFGFTQEDVALLRDEANFYADDNVDGSESNRTVWYTSLADRIAALLPPSSP